MKKRKSQKRVKRQRTPLISFVDDDEKLTLEDVIEMTEDDLEYEWLEGLAHRQVLLNLNLDEFDEMAIFDELSWRYYHGEESLVSDFNFWLQRYGMR